MIISHKHKFIFIKNKKVAGTSFEIMLSDSICGNQDIITPISHNDELLRKKHRYGNNYKTLKYYQIKKILNRISLKTINKSIFFTGFYNHITLEQINAQISSNILNEYSVVMIVWNPYDRLISQFFYDNRRAKFELSKKIFNEWLNKNIDNLPTQSSFVKINGSLKIDQIIRYENLLLDTQKFLYKFGFKGDITMPNAKSGIRNDNITLDSLEKSAITIINKKFEEDFYNFDYKKVDLWKV